VGGYTPQRRLHHETVRKELERFRGREVDTAGDGFLALFDGPARAIQCGLVIREKLHSSESTFGRGSTPEKSSALGTKSVGSPSTLGRASPPWQIALRFSYPERWSTWSPDPVSRSWTEVNISSRACLDCGTSSPWTLDVSRWTSSAPRWTHDRGMRDWNNYLPLNLPREVGQQGSGLSVETTGLEPATSCLQSRCSSQLSYVPDMCD
jgi:hypothetical protein